MRGLSVEHRKDVRIEEAYWFDVEGAAGRVAMMALDVSVAPVGAVRAAMSGQG